MKRFVAFLKRIWHRKAIEGAKGLTGKAVTPAELTPEMKVAAFLFNRRLQMISDYRKLIGYTGGVVQSSLVTGYDRAFTDILSALVPKKERAKALKKNAQP